MFIKRPATFIQTAMDLGADPQSIPDAEVIDLVVSMVFTAILEAYDCYIEDVSWVKVCAETCIELFIRIKGDR